MGQCPHRRRVLAEPVGAELSLGEQAIRASLAHMVTMRRSRDPRTGHTVIQMRRARRRFKVAVRRVVHWLLLRRRWAAVGRLLQEEPRADLWVGLHRRAGRLYRREPAPTPL